MTKTKTLTVLLEAPFVPKFNQHTEIHPLAKMTVLYHHLQVRGKGQRDFMMATDFFWGGGGDLRKCH